MDAILAIDALEYDKVTEYGLSNLKQKTFGKTDITGFAEPRTLVLWSSFMTGENREREVLAEGDEMMWHISWPLEETVFTSFDNPLIIDLPGYSYDHKVHDQSRKLLKQYFESEGDARQDVFERYNKLAREHHRKVKDRFIKGLDAGHDLVLGYFSLADTIGHLSFGVEDVVEPIYAELDELAETAAAAAERLLIISDHGMTAVGRYGDHSGYGFWSLSYDAGLKNPKITDFRGLIEGWKT
jgi:hypothetical protein